MHISVNWKEILKHITHTKVVIIQIRLNIYLWLRYPRNFDCSPYFQLRAYESSTSLDIHEPKGTKKIYIISIIKAQIVFHHHIIIPCPISSNKITICSLFATTNHIATFAYSSTTLIIVWALKPSFFLNIISFTILITLESSIATDIWFHKIIPRAWSRPNNLFISSSLFARFNVSTF